MTAKATAAAPPGSVVESYHTGPGSDETVGVTFVVTEETEQKSAEQWKAAYMAMRGENTLLQRRIIELELSGAVCVCGRGLGSTFGESERKRRKAEVQQVVQQSQRQKGNIECHSKEK